MNKDILKRAIELRKPIEFRYPKEGKTEEKRIGAPHILYTDTNSEEKIDIYQTGGASDSGLTTGSSWRQFFVESMTEITILTGEPTFGAAAGYNPSSPRYTSVISEISPWIDSSEVKYLDVRRDGIIGGCIMIRYVVTTDGNVYFIRPK